MTIPTYSGEQIRLQRLDEASEWFLRMQNSRRTFDEMNEWLRWIDSDAENFAEFERLQRDWIDLDGLKGDEPILAPQQKSALLEQESDDAAACYSTSRLIERRRVWAFAAGVAVAGVLAAGFHHAWTSSSAPIPQLEAAATNRAATLPDGSQMILGARSRVNMDFNGPKRHLDLSDGEAYFKVRHDKSRPFVVRAGELSVTAIGTAFDVRREQEHVTVTVEEGIVEVSSHASGGPPAIWRAEAGYQLTYSTRDRITSLARVNPDTELAWRSGELAYVREPLGLVVQNLNRYSARKIVIEDAEIAALPVSGTAFVSSLDDWLAGIEQAYSITARRTGSGDIILSKEE